MANNGLITLNTDLKSLRYGTIPLGSDKPYVTKDIGQAPGSQIGAEISHRIDDVSRIAQMLIGKPGIKYLLHEAQLQQIGVGQRIKKAQKQGKSLVGAVLQQVGSTLLNTVKIAGSTLAQVPVNGTGTHFLKGFRTDTYLKPGANEKVPGAFASFFGAGGVEGAPFALRGEVVPTNIKSDFYDPEVDYTAPSPEVAQIDSLNLSKTTNKYLPKATDAEAADGIILDAFLGTGIDPLNRTYLEQQQQLSTARTLVKGISNQNVTSSLGDNGNPGLQQTYTNVKDRSYTKHTTEENIASVLTLNPLPTGGPVPYNEIEHKFSSIAAVSSASIENHKSQHNPDLYRIYKEDDTYSQEQAKRQISPDKPSRPVAKERRVGLGDQGLTSKAGVNYFTPARLLERDQVNMLDVGDRQDAAEAARDMAKFYFEIITPDDVGEGTFLYFRAHIKSLDDSFNADWQARKYNGRAENFYTYGGFDRDISISFTIAAATRTEMRPLYRKMVYLASATAPTYGEAGLMRGTLARITVGSYLDQIPGVITSVKYNLVDEAPWEIAMGQPEGVETDVQVLPMLMDCSISFKPIHDFAPQTGLKHYFTNSHAGVKFF